MYYFHVICTFGHGSGLDQDIKIVESDKKFNEETFVSCVLDGLDMDQVEQIIKLSVRELAEMSDRTIEHVLPFSGKKFNRSFFLFDSSWGDSDDTHKWILFKSNYEQNRRARQRAREIGAVASRTRGSIQKQITQYEQEMREIDQNMDKEKDGNHIVGMDQDAIEEICQAVVQNQGDEN